MDREGRRRLQVTERARKAGWTLDFLGRVSEDFVYVGRRLRSLCAVG